MGSLLFDERRWLNPIAEGDRALLQQVLHLCLLKNTDCIDNPETRFSLIIVVSFKARSDRSLIGRVPCNDPILRYSLSLSAERQGYRRLHTRFPSLFTVSEPAFMQIIGKLWVLTVLTLHRRGTISARLMGS